MSRIREHLSGYVGLLRAAEAASNWQAFVLLSALSSTRCISDVKPHSYCKALWVAADCCVEELARF